MWLSQEVCRGPLKGCLCAWLKAADKDIGIGGGKGTKMCVGSLAPPVSESWALHIGMYST